VAYGVDRTRIVIEALELFTKDLDALLNLVRREVFHVLAIVDELFAFGWLACLLARLELSLDQLDCLALAQVDVVLIVADRLCAI
jgi:hypothetical protein